MPNRSISKVLFCFAVAVVPFAGCGPDMTPTGPKQGEIQAYLDEHPEALVEEESDIDDGTDDGSGE